MDVSIALFIGFILGGFFMYALSGGEPIGTLRIDTSDPDDGPYLFLAQIACSFMELLIHI